jgi:hypothetical protein
MSAKVDDWDNACAASVWAMFKTELMHDKRCATREGTKRSIFEHQGFLQLKWFAIAKNCTVR